MSVTSQHNAVSPQHGRFFQTKIIAKISKIIGMHSLDESDRYFGQIGRQQKMNPAGIALFFWQDNVQLAVIHQSIELLS
jgi:hypothetical protein